MSEATKSHKNCRQCNTPRYVLRLQWQDFYPEGSRWYDDHICLGCGRYVDQSVFLYKDSLLQYRIKYGDVVGYPESSRERNTDE